MRVDHDKIPKELRSKNGWVNWEYSKVNGKDTKVPINPRTGGKAQTNNPDTWATYEEAVRMDKNKIGFVFSPDDEYVGIDLDGCRDPETGAVDGRAAKIIAGLNSYTEVTPSGKGFHIIARGTLPNKKKVKGVELFPYGYFTVTGHEAEDQSVSSEIKERQEELTKLYEWVCKHNGSKPNGEMPKGWQDEALQGVGETLRHDTALKLASRWKAKGLSDQEIALSIVAWNQTNKPVKPSLADPNSVEIQDIIAWVNEQEGKKMDNKASDAPPIADLREWMAEHSLGTLFYPRTIYDEFNVETKAGQSKVRKDIKRLCKEGWCRPDPNMAGRYRTSKPIKKINFNEVKDQAKIFPIKLPLIQPRGVALRPGDVLLNAGDTGTGKTTFCNELVSLNIDRHKIQYFVETGENKDFEIKRQLTALGVDLNHPNLSVYEKIDGYEEYIEPSDGIIIIDYVLPSEDFSDAGRLLKIITDRIYTGVAIIMTQKHPYLLMPYGGRLAYHHVHHMICMDRVADKRGEMVIAKTQRESDLPIGSRTWYTIENNLYFRPYDPLKLAWDEIDIHSRLTNDYKKRPKKDR